MPRLTADFKEAVKQLSRNELQEIVLKLASKERNAYDFITVNYLDKETGEKELYETTIDDLEFLFCKGYKGFSVELRAANMISACVKRINEFSKCSKNKVLEADLLVYILDSAVFANSDARLGTCFTNYDYKVALVVKRLLTLVTTKLHPDQKLDYVSKVNFYLEKLHRQSNHLDMVFDMPKSIS